MLFRYDYVGHGCMRNFDWLPLISVHRLGPCSLAAFLARSGSQSSPKCASVKREVIGNGVGPGQCNLVNKPPTQIRRPGATELFVSGSARQAMPSPATKRPTSPFPANSCQEASDLPPSVHCSGHPVSFFNVKFPL